MRAEAAGRAPMMSLRELVNRYRALVGEYGREAPLSGFALTHGEVEQIFSSLDEDYHISRFFHFSEKGNLEILPEILDETTASPREPFLINGEAATHVTISAEIESIL